MQLPNLALSVTIFLAGSVSLQGGVPRKTDAATLRTEIVSPDGVSIQSAHAKWYGDRVLVSGYVQRKFGYSYPGPMHSHLDLIVLDAKGRSLSTSTTNYLPRTIPINYRGSIGRASYAEYLPIRPPVDATVRVLHDQRSIKECRQETIVAKLNGARSTGDTRK